MELTEAQKQKLKGHICPYCNVKSEYVDSKVVYGKRYGMIYLCRDCDAYVGVHKGTDNALGRLANKQLRDLKIEAHESFDRIWKEKIMSRKNAYKWLSQQLDIPFEYTHIGMFSEITCQKVIKISKDYLATYF